MFFRVIVIFDVIVFICYMRVVYVFIFRSHTLCN